jgi:hypothetical protein
MVASGRRRRNRRWRSRRWVSDPERKPVRFDGHPGLAHRRREPVARSGHRRRVHIGGITNVDMLGPKLDIRLECVELVGFTRHTGGGHLKYVLARDQQVDFLQRSERTNESR